MLYSIHQDNLYYADRIRDREEGNKIHVKYKIWICAATLMWGATCFLSFSIGYHYEYIHYNCSDTVIRDF